MEVDYRKYEQLKSQLPQDLTPSEYEKAVQKIMEKLENDTSSKNI